MISNAIKFTPNGGRIGMRLAPQGERVVVSVADTGVGIPEALLFDKFTKARRPGLRGEQSTGLSMSVINTIVGLHQGRIWFDSTEGTGTTFHIELSALPAKCFGQ
jgi:two-component system sensor histidine kinase VicK